MTTQPILDIATLGVPEDRNLANIARGWESALKHSAERLAHLYQWDDGELEKAKRQGLVILETTCLFVHACIKPGQFRLPSEFWRILHLEYGIVVYPSAFTELVRLSDGDNNTFTSAYRGHVVMFGRGHRCSDNPPCPFAYLQEPPPKYEKLPSGLVKPTSLLMTPSPAVYEKRLAFPAALEHDHSSNRCCGSSDAEYTASGSVRDGNDLSSSLKFKDYDAETSSDDGDSSWEAFEQDALDSQDGCASCVGCREACNSD